VATGRLAEELSIPFLGEVPIDIQARASGDAGVPIVVDAPDSPAAKALLEVAGRLAAQLSIQARRTLRVVQ